RAGTAQPVRLPGEPYVPPQAGVPKEADSAARGAAMGLHSRPMWLHELGIELLATTDLRRTLYKLLDVLIELQGADFGNAQLYDRKARKLYWVAQRGFETPFLERFAEISVGGEEGATACGLAVASRERVIVEDVLTDERAASIRADAGKAGFRAVQSTPLCDASGQVLAVVSTHFREPRRTAPEELQIVDACVRQAAGVVAALLRERLLRRREARLQSALEAGHIGTWEWQPESDALMLDARAREILSFSRDREPGSNRAFERRIHSEDLERRRDAIRRARDPAGSGRFEIQFRWLREDGRQLWLDQSGQARSELSLAGKPVTLLSGTLRDVTERRSSREALEAASRHKDRFLATLAHELRNPLAPLRYAAELLHGAGREDLNWSRDVIDRQVVHLTRLVDDLLDISRVTRELLGIQKRPVELAEVVQAALESCRPVVAQAGQQLIVQLPSEPIYVSGDAVRLTQVVVNLLKNASKFTQGEGRIRVMAARRGAEGIISVKDSGIGILPEDLPHVFDVFYQGKLQHGPAQSGLGIGLYLAKRLIELHGGQIEAKSEGPGTGSEFTLRLPVVEETGQTAPSDEPAQTPSGREFKSCRVLVVDDDADSADALARLLRLMGSEVQTAYDGLAAVDAAEQFRPHVVVLDLDMPRLDGYAACRRLRQQPWAKRLRMVALSGWGRREDKERTREAGFDGHLVKPVGRADVENLLEEWRNSLTESNATTASV
ncbi:MAG TPA: ATP-binding protein, partial [Gammaproteobacteria bacterium]|nr:ATP-binding protein [Gammaproteobacteria bacterium]